MGAPCGTAGQLPVSGVPMGAARPPVEEKFARPPTHPPTHPPVTVAARGQLYISASSPKEPQPS